MRREHSRTVNFGKVMTTPQGQTVTFLLTDIEGSTSQWAARPEAMRGAIERHDALLMAGIQSHGGKVLTERGEGDGFHLRDGWTASYVPVLQKYLNAVPE